MYNLFKQSKAGKTVIWACPYRVGLSLQVLTKLRFTSLGSGLSVTIPHANPIVSTPNPIAANYRSVIQNFTIKFQ
jgi:hypothetical protein